MFQPALFCLVVLLFGTSIRSYDQQSNHITVQVNGVEYLNCYGPFLDSKAIQLGVYLVFVSQEKCTEETTWCETNDYDCAAIPNFRNDTTIFNVTIDGRSIVGSGADMGSSFLCWGWSHCADFYYPDYIDSSVSVSTSTSSISGSSSSESRSSSSSESSSSSSSESNTSTSRESDK